MVVRPYWKIAGVGMRDGRKMTILRFRQATQQQIDEPGYRARLKEMLVKDGTIPEGYEILLKLEK